MSPLQQVCVSKLRLWSLLPQQLIDFMSLYFSLHLHRCLGLFAVWDGKDNASSCLCPASQENHWLASKEEKKIKKRTKVRGHLRGMGEALILNFLYSSCSNKIPNILPLHLQFIEFFSDGQLVAKDPFHGRRRVRKSFFVFRKKPCLLLNYFLQHW